MFVTASQLGDKKTQSLGRTFGYLRVMTSKDPLGPQDHRFTKKNFSINILFIVLLL